MLNDLTLVCTPHNDKLAPGEVFAIKARCNGKLLSGSRSIVHG